MKKIATITVYEEADDITGQARYTTELSVDVQSPFGLQEWTVTNRCDYAGPDKGMRRFERVTRAGVNECLKMLKKNISTKRKK